jgi:hypothetical protein
VYRPALPITPLHFRFADFILNRPQGASADYITYYQRTGLLTVSQRPQANSRACSRTVLIVVI